jgi:hypothetical protein
VGHEDALLSEGLHHGCQERDPPDRHAEVNKLAKEAEGLRRMADDDILLVSIGTGSLTDPLVHSTVKSWGQLKWVSPLLDCVFDGTCKTADYILRQLIPPNRYYRFQIEVTKEASMLDSVNKKSVLHLVQYGVNLYDNDPDKCKRLIQELTGSSRPT